MDIDPSKKSLDQKYLPSRAAMKIPEDAKRVRCFVYWNDRHSIDLDLHANAVDERGREIHVGWNGGYNESGIVHSGDITHSNAAEYIDIDLEQAGNMTVDLRLHSYSGVPFNKIEKCYVGLMAVDRIGEKVKLYDPKNCFDSMDITNDSTNIRIGKLDTKERTLYFSTEDLNKSREWSGEIPDPEFSLREYLEILVEAQGGTITEDPEKADVVLTLTKPASEKEVSLIDNNYFFEAGLRKKENLVERAQGQEEERWEKKPDPGFVLETDFTRVYITKDAREAAARMFNKDDGRAVAVMDADTGKVYVADKENIGGVLIKGKGLAKVVMGIEETAELKDYMRVMELHSLRQDLRRSIDEAKERLGIGSDGKDTRDPSIE
jgi:hypothetical protein